MTSEEQLAIESAFELALLLGATETAFRFRDQSIVVDLPKFVTADSNAFSFCEREKQTLTGP